MSSDRLFDAVERVSGSPCGHTESEFAFLSRTSRAPFARVRDELERWFAEFPDAAKVDLAARARGDDHTWAGVFWELYLHNLLCRSGYTVQVHPALAGVTRKPDFRAERKDGSLVVEATSVLGSPTENTASVHRQRIFETLSRLHSPNFWLDVAITEEGPGDLAVGRHRRAIEAWLASLDPDGLEQVPTTTGETPTWSIQADGWVVEIAAIARSKDDRGGPESPLLSFRRGQASEIDDVKSLRKALHNKGSSYGHLDVPFVVAVLTLRDFADDTDVKSALFGTREVRYTQHLDKEDPPPRVCFARGNDGYFLNANGPMHSGVSALLVAQQLRPWRVAVDPPFVWHHPAPDRPLGHAIPLPGVRLDMKTGELGDEPAPRPLSEVLGLTPDWPGFPATRK